MKANECFDLIKTKIENSSKIALICHMRPDGDTLGSALALQNYLLNTKQCTVFCDDVLPYKYNILKNFDNIQNCSIDNTFDLIICLDCSDIKRTGKYSTFIKNHNNVINIDHHISNEKYGDINCIEDVSSTCELIYKILNYFNFEQDKDIFVCLYCGLSSDTGNFSHSNTTYQTLNIASKLAKVIGDISFINQKIFKETPLNRLKLLAFVISEIKIFSQGKIAVLNVSMQDLQKFSCESNQTEGFVDYAINIEGVEIGAIFLESDKNSYKVSLRSKKVNVCKIAAQFGGGGHIHASGCMIFGELNEVIDKFIKNAEFYL